MRAAIIRRIEAAEQAMPIQTDSRIVFMPKGTDEAAFLAAIEAQHATAKIHVVEVRPSEMASDAAAAHALIDALGGLPTPDRKHSEAPQRFDLDTARRLAFAAARAIREMHQ